MKWYWVDWFILGLRTVNFMIVILNLWQMVDQSPYTTILFGALLAYSVPQIFYLPSFIKPYLFLMLEVLLSTTLVISLLQVNVDSIAYITIPIFVITYVAIRVRSYGLLTFLISVMILALVALGEIRSEALLGVILNNVVFIGFGVSFALFINQRETINAVVTTLERTNHELRNYTEEIERLTVLEERNRISKELHDVVGHSITATTIGMEAVATTMKKNPDLAANHLQNLITHSRGALNEFRGVVHQMNTDELNKSLDVLLHGIIERFHIQTSVRVDHQFNLNQSHYTHQQKIVFMRCLQEALTNAVRHGQATTISVELHDDNMVLELIIKDNGRGIHGSDEGFGLKTMRQRMNSINGTLEINPITRGGTQVICRLDTRGGG